MKPRNAGSGPGVLLRALERKRRFRVVITDSTRYPEPMDLKEYLESIKDTGWLDHIMPPDPEDADEEAQIDTMMRVELSLCFPLLTDPQKLILLGAWWAAKAVTLGVNLPREDMPPEDLEPLEERTTSAEQIYMQAKEAVQALADSLPLTDAQRDFIESEILDVPFL